MQSQQSSSFTIMFVVILVIIFLACSCLAVLFQ
jgi:hypothetical protein